MNAPAAALLALLLLTGCATSNRGIAPEPRTELILLTPLPPLTSRAMAFGVKLNVMFHVLPDGTTKEASLLNSSGDPDWDSLALDSLRLWRFTPLVREKEPPDRWVRYGVVVQVQEPIVMRLAEMVIPDRQRADSLFTLLKEGSDFESLGAKSLTGGTEGTWKPPELVNLARYPGHVREKLCTLRTDQFTEPIRIGLTYVIFKRFPTRN